MGQLRINADKPHLWKTDVERSVDRFNEWFMLFAPDAFRSTRLQTTERVKAALLATNDLRAVNVATLKDNPAALATLRMCTAPPLAVDRLIGLSGVPRNVVARMEKGTLPVRMPSSALDDSLARLSGVLCRLMDNDIFPWLVNGMVPSEEERDRAASIVADRLSSAVANPIIRNAQERQQLKVIGDYLGKRGYRKEAHPSSKSLPEMERGTYSFRMNVVAGDAMRVNMPVDVVV